MNKLLLMLMVTFIINVNISYAQTQSKDWILGTWKEDCSNANVPETTFQKSKKGLLLYQFKAPDGYTSMGEEVAGSFKVLNTNSGESSKFTGKKIIGLYQYKWTRDDPMGTKTYEWDTERSIDPSEKEYYVQVNVRINGKPSIDNGIFLETKKISPTRMKCN